MGLWEDYLGVHIECVHSKHWVDVPVPLVVSVFILSAAVDTA